MTPGRMLARLSQPLWLFVALLPLTGCDESDRYPADLKYHVRTDFMVADIPKLQPTAFNTPGRMPLDFLSTLPRQFDPSRKAKLIDYAKVEQMVKDKTLVLDDNQKALLEESKTNIIDPRNLTKGEHKKIDELLTKVFGTPSEPTVRIKASADDVMGITAEDSKELKLDAETLKEGSKLYRRHCLHCHGLEGNGRGPTGYWVNPHPRDYRQGIFKFTSSTQDLGQRKPRRDDLMHIISHGIEGSSMPSFAMYPREDLEKIVSYVIHLSMRGEVEYYVIKKWSQENKMADPLTAEDVQVLRTVMQNDKKPADEIEKTIKDFTKVLSAEEEKTALAEMDNAFAEAIGLYPSWWVTAQKSAIVPDEYPYPDTEEALLDSAARGATLFNTGTASCVSCHKNYGREAPYYFDAWGTIVRPRNLAEGYYRGGRRPIDLYYRVWSGINGAGMASYDKELRPTADDKAGKIDKMWDLVNFMQVLHYPDLRAKLKNDRKVKID